MKIKKVLFATDFRTMTLPELKALFPLKKVGLEEILFFHVIDIRDVGFVPYGGFLKDAKRRMEAETEARFRDWSKTAEKEGFKVETNVKVGVPWRSVLSEAQEKEVQMVALGTEKDDPDDLSLGTTGLKILRHTEVPVLVLKEVEKVGRTIFGRVLLATDFSLPSERALGWVMALAPIIDRVDLVHVLSDKEIQDLDMNGIRLKMDQCENNLNTYVQELLHLDLEAKAHVFTGKTSQEIVKAAQDLGTTLIVMGTTGKDSFKELWLGSASHRTGEMASQSILLVP